MLHKLFSDEYESLGPQPSPSQMKRRKVIPPKRQNRRRQTWNGHRRSARRHVLVLISLVFLSSPPCVRITKAHQVTTQDKNDSCDPIKLFPAPPSLTLSLSFFSLSRSRITLIETKPLPRGNRTLILSYNTKLTIYFVNK